MPSASARLKALNLDLPPLPAPIGNYGAFRIGGENCEDVMD